MVTQILLSIFLVKFDIGIVVNQVVNICLPSVCVYIYTGIVTIGHILFLYYFQIVYKLIDLGYAKNMEHGSVCHSFVGTMQYLVSTAVKS